jgi:hypothetical protein
MKKYTLIDNNNNQAVKDEDGDNVSFVASKDESVVAWLDQKCFEMNGCKSRGRFYIKIEDCK